MVRCKKCGEKKRRYDRCFFCVLRAMTPEEREAMADMLEEIHGDQKSQKILALRQKYKGL